MPRPFAHLHLHTQYSLLDGAIQHKALFARARALGMLPSLAAFDVGFTRTMVLLARAGVPTIEINPGSKFTNGEAVTAKTFVDTWNFTANGGNGQQLGFVEQPVLTNVTLAAGAEEPTPRQS